MRDALKSFCLWAFRMAVPSFEDVLVFGGLASACWGVAQVYEPGAWMLAGVTLFWLGVRRT